MKKSFFIKVIFLIVFSAVVFAQGVTTGAFSGTVVDAEGKPLPGVEIKAVHQPTGTVFTALTKSNGRYFIPALKVGGPYTITTNLDGFRTETKKNVVVKLSETKEFNFILNLATVTVQDVVVTASTPVINPSRTGASQNVSIDEIENLPTISRSISDFTRLAPQFASGESEGSFSAGGKNSRYNNIQIDGSQNNDLFGLGDSGTPGAQTETTPISIDAIQEFQIVLAPYDVRQGMFTGGGVNVITKSGTNTFHGSAYYFGRNEKMVGNGPDDYEFSKFTDGTYGMTFGGPIIKNKLFFFVSGEIFKQKKPEDYYIDGTGSNSDWGNLEDAQRVQAALEKYGYDAGGYGDQPNETTSKKLFVRFDWNINSKHRLTLRHNYVNAEKDALYRNDSRSYKFGNAGILYKNKTNSTVLQLNSTFSESVFNELILNYTTIRDNPTFMGEAFPRVYVSLDGGKSFSVGSDEYRHRNKLDQDLFEVTDNLTIASGNHTFILGTHNEFFKFYNAFVKKEFGVYSFGSVEDLENGNPYLFDRYYSLSDDPNAPSEFSVTQLGFYAGDEWRVKPNLTFTYGIRADVPIIPDDPKANPAVESAFGIPTNQNPGGNILWSPRAGFNWDVKNDNSLQVRGGIGVFSGRTPYVWISNQYGNTGLDLGRYKVYNPDFFITDPYGQPSNPYGGATTSDINLIDKDYKFPQILRTNIAIDKELPFGFVGTVEFVYSKNINEIMYQNINIAPTGETAFDGRPLFGQQSTSGRSKYGRPDYVNRNFYNVAYLSNTDKGYEYNLSFQLQKQWGKGNMINASYTYGMAKSLFSGTSSQALSNWKYNITAGDPNNPTLSYSAHDTRHRFVFAMTKRLDIFKNAPTYVSLFYTGKSGRPYSTRYYNDFNGDGQVNDSIYVPASEDEIILVKGTWADLDKYISDDPALDKYRGQILPRYASRDPWTHKVDFKFVQNLPVPGLKGHKLQLTLTVKNLLNIFDKDWGVTRYIMYDDAPLTFVGYDQASGKPMFEFWGKAQEKDDRYVLNQILSRWKAMVGIRYKF